MILNRNRFCFYSVSRIDFFVSGEKLNGLNALTKQREREKPDDKNEGKNKAESDVKTFKNQHEEPTKTHPHYVRIRRTLFIGISVCIASN